MGTARPSIQIHPPFPSRRSHPILPTRTPSIPPSIKDGGGAMGGMMGVREAIPIFDGVGGRGGHLSHSPIPIFDGGCEGMGTGVDPANPIPSHGSGRGQSHSIPWIWKGKSGHLRPSFPHPIFGVRPDPIIPPIPPSLIDGD